MAVQTQTFAQVPEGLDFYYVFDPGDDLHNGRFELPLPLGEDNQQTMTSRIQEQIGVWSRDKQRHQCIARLRDLRFIIFRITLAGIGAAMLGDQHFRFPQGFGGYLHPGNHPTTLIVRGGRQLTQRYIGTHEHGGGSVELMHAVREGPVSMPLHQFELCLWCQNPDVRAG